MNISENYKKKSRLNKYKSKRQEFASQDDARACRALEKRKDQKLKREKSLAKFRGITTPLHKGNVLGGSSGLSTVKKYTPAERKELGRLRYLEMLKWKEEKKKKIEKEKQIRKPSFKAGVYEPDKPKFLLGEDEPPTKAVTPWKVCSTLRSSNKKSYSGATPSFGSSAFGKVLGHNKEGKERNPKRRISGSFRPPPSLEDASLPSTNMVPFSRKSFAPCSFNFKAPEGVTNFIFDNLNSEACAKHSSNDEEIKTPSQRLDVISEGDDSDASTIKSKERIITSNEIKTETEGGDNSVSKINEEKCATSPRNDESDSSEKEKVYDMNVLKIDEKNIVKNETDSLVEDLKVPPDASEDLQSPRVNTFNAGSTPAPRYSLRKRSINVTTPPLNKLRPRTPCSRSTRRSKSAHCNLMVEIAPTPKSVKKRAKNSVSRKKSVCFNVQHNFDEGINTEEAKCGLFGSLKDENDEITVKYSSNSYDTPLTSRKKDSALSASRLNELVSSSPWVTMSRGSSSSKGKKRRSVFQNPLEALFNEIPMDEEARSPLDSQGSSPNLKHTLVLKEQENNEFFKLIQPSQNIFDSPADAGVWGDESVENIPDNPQNMSKLEKKENELMGQGERNPLVEITSLRMSNLKNENRRSKRPSVSFAKDQKMENLGSKEYPPTPIRRNSKQFSSVKDRVSLLPGLSPFKVGKICTETLIGEDIDLISWDSPDPYQVTTIKKRKSCANTPLRRSTRLSKIP